MPDTNLNIIVSVKNGPASATEIEGVAKATGNVGTATEETSKKTGLLSNTLKTVATGFLAYKAYGFIKGAIDDTTALARQTASLSKITGMDSRTSSAWVGIAKERGLSTSTLNMGFITLSKNMGAAIQGTKASKEAFDQLGISQGDLKRMDTQQTISAVSQAFSKLPDGATKAALASKLFGRSAQSLLPLLNGGSRALNEQIGAMAKHVGMSASDEKSGLALVKQQREMEAAMMGLKVAIATALLPIMQALLQVFLPIVTVFANLMKNSTAFRIIVTTLVAALTTWVAVGRLLAITGLEVDTAWLLIPTAIVAIGVALILLYNKCAWFRDAVNATWSAIKAGFMAVYDAILFVWNWIKSNWPILLGILTGPFGLAAALIITHWKAIKQFVSGVIGDVVSALQPLVTFIAGVFTSAFKAAHDAIESVINAIKTVANLPSKALGIIGKIGGGIGGAVGGLFSHLQGGGTVGPSGTMAVVGEAGPELVALPGGARVIPNHSIGQHMGGGRVPIVTQVFLDRKMIATAMGDYVAGQQAAR